MLGKTHGERCHEEMTRDVVFVLLRPTFHRRGEEAGHVIGVFLDRQEAEAWARSEEHNLGRRWVVYGVCAEGALAQLLRRQDQRLPAEADSSVLRR